jgi:hypothetical protein
MPHTEHHQIEDIELGSDYLRPSISTDVGDLIWEAVEQIDDLAVSALNDWLVEWGEQEAGLPYAGKIDELRQRLEALSQEIHDVAKDIDADAEEDPEGESVSIDDYDAANEFIKRELPSAAELLDDDDHGGPALGSGPITLEDLFGPSDHDEREAKLKDLFAGGTLPPSTIELEGVQTEDE